MRASYPGRGFENYAHSTRLDVIVNDFNDYVKTKSSSNNTMAYWLLYIEMVQVLLLFIRATRENDWALHLSAVRSMLPWFFAADRVNYARYGSIYWLEMISLENSHPGNEKKREDDALSSCAHPHKWRGQPTGSLPSPRLYLF